MKTPAAFVSVAIAMIVLGTGCDSSNAPTTIERSTTERELEVIRKFQALFPQPLPGIVHMSYSDGEGEVIFLNEAPAYFESDENARGMVDEATRNAFAAVPELEQFRVIVP